MTATTEDLIWLVGRRTRFEIVDDALYLHADNGWTLVLHADRRIRPAPNASSWMARISDIHDDGTMLTVVTDDGTFIDVDLSDSGDSGPKAMVLSGPGENDSA